MKLRLHSVIAIALVLSACSSGPVAPPVDNAALEAGARAAMARGDFAAARSAFEQLVQRTDGDARRSYQIELAQTEIRLGTPELALTRLDGILPPLSDGLRAALMATRADALFALGDAAAAVRVLVDREVWLDTREAILDNQSRIWNGLANAALTVTPATGDTTLDGWLALAPLTRLTDDGTAFLSALIDWRNRFPGHPAGAGILAEQFAGLRSTGGRPLRIALLLPLGAEGELRLQAEAIREGFFAAGLSSDREAAPEIVIFDTAGGNAVSAYRDAQLAGADFIVGPLDREAVRLVQPEAGFVPTLALNLGSENTFAAAGFYQFALSSDDEIEAIATRAVADGYETAVVLHNYDTRGLRLRDNFIAAFESRGGRVIASRDYDGASGNLARPVEDLLNIAASDARFVRLRENLGRAIEFEPRRRADIDMIFLQADPGTGPEDARLLVPLLERYDAAEIPTFATASVFDPARERSDTDLDGLIIPELPMLIEPVGDARVAADLLAGFTSRSAAYNRRLFAFGYDAYRLAEMLYTGSSARWPLDGATGQLVLVENGRIRRLLPFGEFSGGQLRGAPALRDTLSSR